MSEKTKLRIAREGRPRSLISEYYTAWELMPFHKRLRCREIKHRNFGKNISAISTGSTNFWKRLKERREKKDMSKRFLGAGAISRKYTRKPNTSEKKRSAWRRTPQYKEQKRI